MRASTSIPSPKYKFSRVKKHDQILGEARKRLQSHPQFRGREHLVRIDEKDGQLILKGRVPSYYVKQLLQTVLRGIEGVKGLDNRVRVLYPN